jgi:hypothetical protein
MAIRLLTATPLHCWRLINALPIFLGFSLLAIGTGILFSARHLLAEGRTERLPQAMFGPFYVGLGLLAGLTHHVCKGQAARIDQLERRMRENENAYPPA